MILSYFSSTITILNVSTFEMFSDISIPGLLSFDSLNMNKSELFKVT